MSVVELLPIVTTLASGGLLAAVLQAKRATRDRRVEDRRQRVDDNDILNRASTTAVEVFQATVEQLQEDLEKARIEVRVLTRSLEMSRFESQEVIAENVVLRREVKSLKSRVQSLEDVNDER